MPLTVAVEASTVISVGAEAQIAPTRTGRVGMVVQNQSRSIIWVKLSGAASKGDGFRVGPWAVFTLGAGRGNEFYEGPVSVFVERNQGTSPPDPDLTSATIRVIEVI